MAAADNEKAFLGIGWAFPLCVEADRTIATAAYEQDVKESIEIILGTNYGERVMRPTFGAGLRDFVFEPVNMTTIRTLQKRVEDALIDWEPRIEVNTVKVTSYPEERQKLYITISYRIRATNTQHNLVYPFYLQEGTPE